MAPSGPVLLLLSSFLACSLCGLQRSHLPEDPTLQNRGKKLDVAKSTGEYFMKIATAVKPFVALIPGSGLYIKAAISFVNTLTGKSPNKEVLYKLKKQIDDLKLKIDKNHKEMEYAIQVSTFADLEKNINAGWMRLQELLEICAEPEKCKEILKDYGEKFFKSAERSLYGLHEAIVGEGVYTNDYEKLVKDKIRCHEGEIKKFSAVNAALVFKAITMTHIYNIINDKETPLQDNLVNKARGIAAATFKIHSECILEPDKYVKLDILDRINESVRRKDLANNIMTYLSRTYDRYDWMVVAFITENSKHENFFTKWKNRHVFSGFTEVSKGATSVAFAKQIKGTHNKSAEMIKVIHECYSDRQICNKVKKTLDDCVTKVGEPKVVDMYSALHAYIHKKHDAAGALVTEDVPTEGFFGFQEGEAPPFIYSAVCSISFLGSAVFLPYGNFKVLLKSDEELMKTDPCQGIECGGEERGKCVPLEKALIGVCECKKEYYGEMCEESLEEYKKNIFTAEILNSSDSTD